jgi:hypothetical protein
MSMPNAARSGHILRCCWLPDTILQISERDADRELAVWKAQGRFLPFRRECVTSGPALMQESPKLSRYPQPLHP